MRTISFFNLKGGVGKTTSCRNMGSILAEDYNKRVLLLDLDCSGNLSDSLRLRPERNDTACLTSVITDVKTVDPHDFILHTNIPGLDIIPGNNTLEACEKTLLLDTLPQHFNLKRQLEKVKSEYDYCIIDCPPSGSDLLLYNALIASQEIIIPAHICMDSFDAILRVIASVSELSDYNPGLTIRGILLIGIGNNAVDKEGARLQFSELGINVPRFSTYIRNNSAEVQRARSSCMHLKEYKREFKRKPFYAMKDYCNFVAEYLHEPLPYPDEPYLE